MDNWCKFLGLATILHSGLIQTEFVNSITEKLISAFLDADQIKFAVFITCGAAGND
jgi:phosphotransferase system  glucose/maltose/N-acetylglucosamine-specific IIC component